MLRETGADSVVSVVRWPQQYSPDFVCHIMDGQLWAYGDSGDGWSCYSLSEQPTRRQDAFTGWKRDGTVYTLYTRTLRSGTLYGSDVRPLILDPSESCEMDTEQDWQAVERRWEEREQPKPEGAWPIECLGCGRFNPKTATACLYCTQELPR
jgi:CMP-N-acetylneuraminic acid synthetase